MVLATGVASALIAVATASAAITLGPHDATISTTLAHVVRVDLGPLGALELDSPAPWPLGVEVVVGEIPASLSEVSSPLESLTGDVSSYVQFFSQPTSAIEAATTALLADILRRTILLWSIALVLVAAGKLAAGGLLRVSLYTAVRRRGVAPLVGAVAVAAIVLPLGSALTSPRSDGRTSAVLAQFGGVLADARVTGRVGELLDTYGQLALDELDENEAYYEQVQTNMAEAFAANPSPLGPVRVMLPVDPDGVAVRWPADGEERAEPDLVSVLVIADIHCNIGMAPVFGQVARLAQVDLVLNAGDSTLGGSTVERVCMDAVADALTDFPVVVADGNHDSRETGEQEAARGWTVLDGGVVEVEGLRIVGDRDPRLTSVTLGNQEFVSKDEMGEALTQAACAGQAEGGEHAVDLLLIHDPVVGERVMPSGCVVAQISGHYHRRIGPVQQGLGLLYVNASSGGAKEGVLPLGPLQAPAYLTILSYDRANHVPVALREITIGVDQSVTLSRWEPWPVLPTDVVEADLSLAASPVR